MMTTMNHVELSNTELDLVNGGNFFRNSLSEKRYNEAGIRTEYHTFSADEFWLPDGTKTDMQGANEYVKKVYGEETYREWYNEHDLIGCSKPLLRY